MTRARFISLEGVEGAGKTTAIRFIQQQLQHHHIDFMLTREPGGTPIAEKIRALLLDHQTETLYPDTEALLMFASRAQHVQGLIRPALAKGQWVISDRFTDASFAYQGGGRGISETRLNALAQWVLGDFEPDLTLLMDLPVEVGLERMRARGNADRIEQEKSDFFERIRAIYLQRAKENPHRFRIIQADQPLEVVEKQIAAALAPLLH